MAVWTLLFALLLPARAGVVLPKGQAKLNTTLGPPKLTFLPYVVPHTAGLYKPGGGLLEPTLYPMHGHVPVPYALPQGYREAFRNLVAELPKDDAPAAAVQLNKLFDAAISDKLLSEPVMPTALESQVLEGQKSFVSQTLLQMRQRSNQITRTLRGLKKRGKHAVVDVLGVGGGPHAAMLFSSLRQLAPQAKFAVLENTDRLGTFNKLGYSFYSNSAEENEKSGNPFRGSPIQVRDLNVLREKFVPSGAFGNATVLGHAFAGSNVIFQNEAMKLEIGGEGWPARYKVTTNKGLTIYANIVVSATGLGLPNGESMTGKAPAVQTVDDLLLKAELAGGGLKALSPYKGKKILVVGSAAGGRVAAELLGGQAPNVKQSKIDVQMDMLGEKAPLSIEQFKEMQPNNVRYFGTLERMFASGALKGRRGRMDGYRLLDDGGLLVTLTNSAGLKEEIRYDHVVMATGYKGTEEALLDGTRVELEKLRLPVDEHCDVGYCAKQAKKGEVKEDVYIYGGALKIEPHDGAEPSEWPNRGGYLDAIGARTAALARYLAGRLSDLGLIQNAPKIFNPAKVPAVLPQETEGAAKLHAAMLAFKLRLARLLLSGKAPGAGELAILLTEKTTAAVGGWRGLETRLKIDYHLATLFETMKTLGVTRVSAAAPTKADGRVKLDELKLSVE